MIDHQATTRKKSKRKITLIILVQAALCAIEAYLISKISLIGKIGIALVHKEYSLLRSAWKTYVLFFAIQLVVITTLALIERKNNRRLLRYTAWGLIAVALSGLIFTFSDFMHTYSHRLLKERFHLGFYLFWMGWMGSCAVFLFKRPAQYDHLPNRSFLEFADDDPCKKNNERADNDDHVGI